MHLNHTSYTKFFYNLNNSDEVFVFMCSFLLIGETILRRFLHPRGVSNKFPDQWVSSTLNIISRQEKDFYSLFRSETLLDFHDLVRNSAYYLRLPHLPVECNEFDGVPDTLPILIEEVYCERDEQKNFPTLTTKSTTNEDTKTNAVVG